MTETQRTYLDLLGLKITYRGKDRFEGEIIARDDLCRVGDMLHGGVFMGLGDSLGAQASLVHLPEGKTTSTIESKTNFFASVKVGETVRCVSTPLHVGRTTIVVESRIFRSDGKLAAIVTQTQIVLDRR
jgi:1,4-dihydroxy-2-naphthoyl-CoA hydrolase